MVSGSHSLVDRQGQMATEQPRYEFAPAIRCDRVNTKFILIDELKRAVHEIRPEVVLESCASWLSRLSRILRMSKECLPR
jgi:hypothetical protein